MLPGSCHLSNYSVKLHWTHLYLQKKLKLRGVEGFSQSYSESRTKRTGSYVRKEWILEELGEEGGMNIIKIDCMHVKNSLELNKIIFNMLFYFLTQIQV